MSNLESKSKSYYSFKPHPQAPPGLAKDEMSEIVLPGDEATFINHGTCTCTYLSLSTSLKGGLF